MSDVNQEKPKRVPISEITAELYCALKEQRLKVWFDYVVASRAGTSKCLAVLNSSTLQPAALVVVKSSPNAARTETRKTRRLAAAKLPMVIVRSLDDIPGAVREIYAYAGPPNDDHAVAALIKDLDGE